MNRRCLHSVIWACGAFLSAAYGQSHKETPVGLVLVPGGGSITTANSETPLAAKSGDILFPGDVLKTGGGPATFLYCPTSISATLAPASEVLFQAGQLKVRSGKISAQNKAGSCFLPTVLRVANASQQHYGASMVRALKTEADPKPVPPDKLDAAVLAELRPLDEALRARPDDAAAKIARAAVFEKHNLPANALAEYTRISAELPDAVWIKGKIFELGEALATTAVTAPSTPGGKTFAVLIGISNYQKLPRDLWLQFAAADALTFELYLKSPRGGGVLPENMIVLTDAQATTAAIRNAFQTFLKGRAGKGDTVFVSIASHGTVETPGNKAAYIVTYDSDPQDLASTALPMAEIQDLVQTELSKVGRVVVFVDVCRAGNIGAIHSTTVNAAVERLGEADGEILGLMASRPKELSREGPQFGGGHGAFTYYVLKGLDGAADKNQDGVVNVNEEIEYVRREVAQATEDKQHPRDFGTLASDITLADVKKPGIPLARWPVLVDPRGGPLFLASAAAPPPQGDISRDVAKFSDALRAGRILPDSPESAFAALRELKSRMTPAEYLVYENQLRVAPEDRGQQVLLRYLQGDQIAQSEDDFRLGARYFEAASLLTPESLYLDSRIAFCRGRALLFEKQFPTALNLLERSMRIDPGAAYAYNALGIAYLEQGDFNRAIPAFRDSVRRAPQWTYPLHNLALASMESGDYSSAIRYYERAIRLSPNFSYLHYNLGLVYQRLNRLKDAELAYRDALAISPDMAEVYNALGSLKAAGGKAAQAETFYRQALEKNVGLLAARQNLALLLSARDDRQREAIDLWHENLSRSPQYLPSMLSLAETFARRGESAPAIDAYREVLKLRPDYVAARVALADLLRKTRDFNGALEQLQVARMSAPRSPEVLERIGDVQAEERNFGDAATAYNAALAAAADGETRKRLRLKLLAVPKQGRT